MTTLDWSQCPAVESIPGKVSGAWVFKDTHLPVALIFENLQDGMTSSRTRAPESSITTVDDAIVVEHMAVGRPAASSELRRRRLMGDECLRNSVAARFPRTGELDFVAQSV
jgi:hypothetical protein